MQRSVGRRAGRGRTLRPFDRRLLERTAGGRWTELPAVGTAAGYTLTGIA